MATAERGGETAPALAAVPCALGPAESKGRLEPSGDAEQAVRRGRRTKLCHKQRLPQDVAGGQMPQIPADTPQRRQIARLQGQSHPPQHRASISLLVGKQT